MEDDLDAPVTVLGRWDAPAQTGWNNGCRLWVSPQELRVSNANGWGRDRVVRWEPGTEIRQARALRGTKLDVQRPGRARRRRLCIYLRTSGMTIPKALQSAGWIDAGGDHVAPSDVFFRCCRVSGRPRRGWLVVEASRISVQRRRSRSLTLHRDQVSEIRIGPQRRWSAPITVIRDRDGELEELCGSFSPDDLRSALLARGWPVVDGPL